MVRGLELFKRYFEHFSDNYVIIGGTACDIIIEEAGFVPRATKDIDIILVVEALTTNFVKQFWQFIKDGKYERKEKSSDERKYYRFIKPENRAFPFQLELFSRVPDLLDLDEEMHLTPIPVDDDLSSLSAILMNQDYYNFTIDNSVIEDGINIAKTEALICLKAKAFLDLTARKAQGDTVDKRNINKHKTDIFRLAVFLTVEDKFQLPESIKEDLSSFIDIVTIEPPNKSILKDMGLVNIEMSRVLELLTSAFLTKKLR